MRNSQHATRNMQLATCNSQLADYLDSKLIHIWYKVDKKYLLFTKRKCHKFSWLFTASRCSPRRRSICACRIACKVLVSIGLYSLSFDFLKKRLPSWKTVFVKRDRWGSPYFRVWFSKKESFFEETKAHWLKPMDTSTLHAILHAQIDILLGEQRDAVNNHENLWHFLFVNKRCFLAILHHLYVMFLFIFIICFHK